MTLATNRSHQQTRWMAVNQLEQLRLGDIAGQQLTILDHIDAEQGGLHTEVLRKAMQGRTRTEDITHVGFPAVLQPVGQIIQHQLFGLHAALLDLLHIAAFLRHRQFAVPACGYAPLTQGAFINIAHFTAAQAHQAAFDKPRSQFAGSARADGVDPGLNLHPGRNPQHRLAFAHSGADIPRRTIATSEQNQRHASTLQQLNSLLGIGGAARTSR